MALVRGKKTGIIETAPLVLSVLMIAFGGFLTAASGAVKEVVSSIALIYGLVLIIGGAYGFSPAVYARANGKLSLSQMTFSHQMIRIMAIEQLYRAMTILRNEPYHHE